MTPSFRVASYREGQVVRKNPYSDSDLTNSRTRMISGAVLTALAGVKALPFHCFRREARRSSQFP